MFRFGRMVDARVRAVVSVAAVSLVALVLPSGAGAAGCSQVVSSASAAASAVSSAPSGSVVCLADGSYGRLSLSASKSAPGVVVRAEHPGLAT